MKITSDFETNGKIPIKFTCDALTAVSPKLNFSDVPVNARSLVLIMEDPDVPKQLRPDGIFDHWIMFNIPPNIPEVSEGKSVGLAGANSTGKTGYIAPCPPPQYDPAEHRYVFTLYALDIELLLKAGSFKKEILAAMDGHVIEKAEFVGRYKRMGK